MGGWGCSETVGALELWRNMDGYGPALDERSSSSHGRGMGYPVGLLW